MQHGIRQHDKKFLVAHLGMILATDSLRTEGQYSLKRSRPWPASATGSSAAGFTARNTRHSSRDARFPKRLSTGARPP